MSDLSRIRKRAWVTRRAKYGPRGHNGTYTRCRRCERILALLIRLHEEAVLSEGQVARATGYDRITIRRLADEARAHE